MGSVVRIRRRHADTHLQSTSDAVSIANICSESVREWVIISGRGGDERVAYVTEIPGDKGHHWVK